MQHSIVESIAALVEEKFRSDGTGHDWHHIARVWRTAISIGKAEGADMLLVELGALLHDIADHKFHNHDLKEGPKQARALITGHGGSEELAEKVAQIVSEVSFKGAGVETPVTSIEAAVVQDADRLDAIGAIGIARAFAYGGSKHRPLYDPDKPPNPHHNFRDYATDQGHTINHFYEKLLLLKARMQTETGKRMAAERHQFMEKYLSQFMAEWDGDK
jgi:uncharacterized protein